MTYILFNYYFGFNSSFSDGKKYLCFRPNSNPSTLLVWRGRGGGVGGYTSKFCLSACTVLYIWLLKNAQWIGSLWILLAWNWFWDNWYWFLSKSLIFCFLINTEKSIVSSNMLFRETSMGCHHDLSYLPVSVFISHLLAPCTLNIWCPKQSMRWSMIV